MGTMTVDEVAELFGVSRGTVKTWAEGGRLQSKYETVVKLCQPNLVCQSYRTLVFDEDEIRAHHRELTQPATDVTRTSWPNNKPPGRRISESP